MDLKGAVVVKWRAQKSTGGFWESASKEIRDSKVQALHIRVCSCGKDRKRAVAMW